MILSALYDYYQRKAADPETALPPFGIELKAIPFLIEIDERGSPIQIIDTRDGKRRAKEYLVPQGEKRSGETIVPYLLWDQVEYALGVNNLGREERSIKKHAAFVTRIEKLPEYLRKDAGIIAVQCFLRDIDYSKLRRMRGWDELTTDWEKKPVKKNNPFVSFQLVGDPFPVFSRQIVIDYLSAIEPGEPDGICLITGKERPIERKHPAIRGVWDAKPTGADIVSFNEKAYYSYVGDRGKAERIIRSRNAPIGKSVAFAYTTALNHLLGSEQRLQVGDASTVFWAQRSVATGASDFPDFETLFGSAMNESPKDDPDRQSGAVKALFTSLNKGLLEVNARDTAFYVLGLAPNAARISVRFWHAGTVEEMASRLKAHFDAIDIVHGLKESPYLSLFRLLKSTAVQEKADNIPPNLGGELMRAILEGLPYPRTLFAAAVERNRATQSVTYPRAAIIKGYLNRLNGPTESEEMTVSLDRQNPSIAYRLGRMFALLEKAQEEANPGINATIRERYFGAASATPVSVFPTLLKLFNHHLAKLEIKGRKVMLEKLAGEILSEVSPDLPSTLSLIDQGRFAVGYYHQREDFFTKKTESEQGED